MALVSTTRSAGIYLLSTLLLAISLFDAEAVSLDDLSSILRIDTKSISVSGVSSGAYMAQQFHVIHSSRIMGVGIIAGGPYNCSGGDYFLSKFDPTGLYAALNICSAANPLGQFSGPPDVEQSIKFTREQAAAKRIDDPSNIKQAKVWLLSGGNDETVPREVVESVQGFYRTFMSAEKIHFETLPGAGHAMITDDLGNPCEVDGAPYINDCDFAAAEALLQYIYGPVALIPKVREANKRFIFEFNQSRYFDPGDNSVSMHALGHIYVPTRCARGERCRLHVAYHGCRQHQDEIGDAFYTQAGYNEVAEANGIIVLYPQTKAWSESSIFQFRENPRACWDWWGYSGDDFLRRSGKQIRAVARMINALLGKDFLPLK